PQSFGEPAPWFPLDHILVHRTDIRLCQYDEQEYDLEETKALVRQMIADGVSDSLLGYARFFQAVGYSLEFKFDSAIWSFELSLPSIEKAKGVSQRMISFWYLAYTYSQLQQPRLATHYYQRALDNAKQLPRNKENKTFVFQLLSTLMTEYSKTGDYRNTLNMLLEARGALEKDSALKKDMEGQFHLDAGSAMSYLAKGEGALSLARAFAYAGSPSVVMSHWPVDDEVTAQVMRSFYDYLADGYAKSEALRLAKLDFLSTGQPSRMHPFFWGSFVVMGDDSPLQISAKRGWSTYGLWVMFIGMVVFGLTHLLKVKRTERLTR
ncbi:MAG: CHAT domain-containing protein, partial [Bacteroidota bacterium]